MRFRREDHTADAAGPCPFYPLSRVTAQGEDLLAWLDRAISEREETARAALAFGDGFVGSETYVYGTGDGGPYLQVVVPGFEGQAEAATKHFALYGPESVLRRCAADRKLIAAHPITRDVITVKPDGTHGFGCTVCHYDYYVEGRGWCDTLLALAEGYGWTEGER